MLDCLSLNGPYLVRSCHCRRQAAKLVDSRSQSSWVHEIHAHILMPLRYQSSLIFPLLDSFPTIVTLSPNPTAVAVHTSLSTTTRISSRLKALQKVVSRIANLDERESLSHSLGDIGEAYEEGWESGSGEDSDD